MGDILEDRKGLRPVYGWIVLVGVYAIVSALLMVPLLLSKTAGRTIQLAIGIPLGLVGILLLLRLTSEILEYRSRRLE
jgi:hypothetical protein